MHSSKALRAAWATLAFGILALVYIFQRVSLLGLLCELADGCEGVHPYVVFIVNRTLRLTINDLACMILIYAFFQNRAYLKLSFYVFLFELLIILPVYLAVKLSLEGDSEISSPLLSQVHRLIVNPMLMILLMIGFFYQRFVHRGT